MTLPDEAVTEFQQLYKKHFNQDISLEEARMRATNLVRLYMAVYFKKRETDVATDNEIKHF